MGKIKVALIVSLWVIPVSILVSRIVPEPYMDEIFHIPQAQQYCKGNFRSWDPMITTPPGLYFVSLAHVASLFPGLFSVQLASSFSETCSTPILRSINGVLAVICSILVYDIITHLSPGLSDRKATLRAVVLALYPLHWFFTFLYYTDIASLAAVLASYLMSLKKNYPFSALLGALAVLVRQTNIIWVLFIACNGVLDFSLAHRKDNRVYADFKVVQEDTLSSSSQSSTMGSNVRKRRTVSHANRKSHLNGQTTASSTHHISEHTELFDEIREVISSSWQMKWDLLASFSPFFITLVAFVTFVYWNGSIVLGAKEAHAVSPHFSQVLYFSLVSAIFMAPVHFSFGQFILLVQSFWKNKLISLFKLSVALAAGLISVHFFSIAHPYLLADNRHYPFYLWRKVINRYWFMKYLLVPIYSYMWLSILSILVKSQKKIWVVAYFLATAATLVPAPLIEFRYYTIPFFFLILHSHVNDDRSWILMGLLYVAVNCFTMFMFLFRPFSWTHEPGVQRFIW
nr:dol-P-Glc:Glc(2)Man(9)GlcNAc(2)-PP-Dol alpha-1,2-glucosyltransferase isoform X1 [Ipomoea batatas]